MNDLTVRQDAVIATLESPTRLTAVDIRAQVNLIQEVMGAVMKKDVHYGIIPGCKQPSLYKAGSEVLLTTFRISVVPEVEDISGPDERRYRVHAKGVHIPTGTVVGVGIGECSSMEEKYKWRKAYDKEWNDTPEDRRRVKHGRDYSNKQVRTEIADVANTILKMAKKRAQVDMTLTALSASDVFAQDIEDLPEGLIDEDHSRPQETQRAEPQPYPAAQFTKNFPTWEGLIKSGKKTAKEVIATISSRAVLSEGQKKAIAAIVVQETSQATEEFLAEMDGAT